MKTTNWLLGSSAVVATLALAPLGRAAVYDFQSLGGGSYQAVWTGTQTISDNNPSGVAYAPEFSFTGVQIGAIQVKLNVSGGWNGDLYAYVSHGSDFSVLLNRVGAGTGNSDGYGNTGFDVTLATSGSDIHNYQSGSPSYDGSGRLTGTYAADGRLAYTDTTRNNTLSVNLGQDAGGSWTLFFADMSGGSVSTLNGWEIDVTAVPEPVNCALGVFGGVLLLVGVRQHLGKRAKPARA